MTIREIIETDNLLSLYEEVNIIHTRNSQIFKDLKEYPNATYSNIDKKEELNINTNKLDALKNQIELIKDTNSRLNHNFRMLAKKVLPKEVYNNLQVLSVKTLSEAKEILKNQIKLEL